jgi:hypothetical protein
MKDILYSTALNLEGQIITTKDAVKGANYSCTICNGEMIFKKGDKEIRRPHFAHKVLSPNCNPETALHNSFVNLLYLKIKNLLEINQPLIIEWKCEFCGDIHQRNLLSKSRGVEKEFSFGPTRLDISLLNDEDKPIIALEVVVTHKPEDETVQYYEQSNITLIEFHLKSDEDIYSINKPILYPTKVNRCLNPKCRTCGRYQYKKYLYIFNTRCWKCKSPIKVALTAYNIMMIDGPENFNNEELDLARSHRVIIKKHYSKTDNSEYLANSCNYCGSFEGKFFHFDTFVDCIDYDNKKLKLDVGYFCEYCYRERNNIEASNNHSINNKNPIPPDIPNPNNRDY